MLEIINQLFCAIFTLSIELTIRRFVYYICIMKNTYYIDSHVFVLDKEIYMYTMNGGKIIHLNLSLFLITKGISQRFQKDISTRLQTDILESFQRFLRYK